MRFAEARLNASNMSKSSIKLLFPGAEVDCRTNTSAPRTFSLISTLLSPSLKVSTTAFPNGTFRYWLISSAKGGLELPAKIFSSTACWLMVSKLFFRHSFRNHSVFSHDPTDPLGAKQNEQRRSLMNGAA